MYYNLFSFIHHYYNMFSLQKKLVGAKKPANHVEVTTRHFINFYLFLITSLIRRTLFGYRSIVKILEYVMLDFMSVSCYENTFLISFLNSK